MAALLNLAAVCLAQHRYGRAVQLCGEALQLQPSNVRARLRRAKAYMARKMYAVSGELAYRWGSTAWQRGEHAARFASAEGARSHY